MTTKSEKSTPLYYSMTDEEARTKYKAYQKRGGTDDFKTWKQLTEYTENNGSWNDFDYFGSK